MKWIVLLVGVILALLGALWMLQGLAVVHIKPILCFADCEPIQRPSQMWAIVGVCVLLVGLLAIYFSIRRRVD